MIEHSLNISVQKTESMAFKRQEPVRSKTLVDNKIIVQANSFNYLANVISYEKEVDIDKKLNNYLKITHNVNDVFKPQKTLKKTRIKLYNTLALTALLYGNESRTIKAGDKRRVTAAEMESVRRTTA